MTEDGHQYLSLSEAELDLRLGDALYADDFGAKDPTDADKRRRAEHWFASQLGEFERAVCAQGVVKRYLEKKDGAERELFDALVAALAALTGVRVPVGVLAAKIVRFGVTRLCTSEPSVDATP